MSKPLHCRELSNEILSKFLAQGASETLEVKILGFQIYLKEEVFFELLNLTFGKSDSLETKLHTLPHLKVFKSHLSHT